MKRMKKIIIFPGYYIPHIGGLETHVDEFVKHLSKDENFEIYVFAPNIPEAEEFEIRYNKVKVYRYPAFEIIPNYPVPNIFNLKFWKMFLNLYKIDFDIVMTRTRFFSNTLLGFIFAKLRLKRKKLIHVEHGSAFVKVENKLVNKIAYLYDMVIGRLIFNKADYVIAISEAVREFIKNFTDREVPVIYRGLEIEEIEKIKEDEEIKERFKDKIKLCFVGRLYKWKGVENIIKAYKLFPKELREKVVLIIVGYGEDLERLKRLSGEYLNNGIYFLGKQPFERAIAIIKSCDIYIHSSYPGGGLSSSLLQAMACGKAIVASPHEGAKEVIVNGVNGILLKDNTPESLKEGIVYLIENRDKWDLFGENCKKLIREKFSWDKNIERYKNILGR
ncbi:glycosyl transferase group 1 [Methanocaldococcus infernus ME]|uniref:Glycosyl transferase group 1 n=1 Tax=Methanocaldococcus infernus (strain DSM 11812 / JCM 15783 / ME) TaxID=573063 RepID=D5VU49_METIM|nr:glycosyltransferase family 4 protein [Methanocaldococcus infernus]ADG14102.1 glycosyl transferase group 1 [Methanocaldococcus infernus ME]